MQNEKHGQDGKFYLKDGEVLFRDEGEGLRSSLLDTAKGLVFALGDTFGCLECHGMALERVALKTALQSVFDAIEHERGFCVRPVGADGHFKLIPTR